MLIDIALPAIKVMSGPKEMLQQLKRHTVLSEGLNSVPSTHIGGLEL